MPAKRARVSWGRSSQALARAYAPEAKLPLLGRLPPAPHEGASHRDPSRIFRLPLPKPAAKEI
jgi:hypothetical protein